MRPEEFGAKSAKGQVELLAGHDGFGALVSDTAGSQFIRQIHHTVIDGDDAKTVRPGFSAHVKEPYINAEIAVGFDAQPQVADV